MARRAGFRPHASFVLYLHSDKTAGDVCRTVGIGRRTLFSYLARVRRQRDGKASTEAS